ncbi:hypothetical protein [Thioflexithrix psekupsensis]|uniref:Uncharacterized protein n=1 Tax=Thioflexithrix psekupsensis TaxID=1570016 RepID=A0A251X6E9_9GAMM|nr:hypothetical protein [Thioflexithrix psekupsensis]OUD12823.1 hypothetical protein TPSD3_12550 [Thioflexithrix psekupsensis]
MKKEYDFSKGIRGKFYSPDARFNLPIYLEPEIAEFIASLKNMDTSQMVNDLLKKDKEIIEYANHLQKL